MFKIFSTYLLNKYLKCNVWRLAVRYDPYMGKLGVKRLNLSCTAASVCQPNFS